MHPATGIQEKLFSSNSIDDSSARISLYANTGGRVLKKLGHDLKASNSILK